MRLSTTAISFLLTVSFFHLSASASAAPLFVVDSPYLQKRTVKFTSRDGLPAGAINSLAFCSEKLFAGTTDGVHMLAGEKWARVAPLGNVAQIGCVDGRLHAAADSGFHAITPDAPDQSTKMFTGPVAAFTHWNNGFLLASGDKPGVAFFSPTDLTATDIPASAKRRIHAMATDSEGVVWAATDSGLTSFKDGTITNHAAGDGLSGPPSNTIRSIFHAAAGKVYFATSQGIGIYDKGGWSVLRGKPDGLPVEDVTAVAVSGDVLAAGFSAGAARRKNGEWEYMQSGRWLPDDRVRSAAIGPDGSLWFGTDNGIAKIEYTPMTLAQKAEFFQEFMPLFLRRGFTGDATITVPGDFSSLKKRAHDNENVWTGMYIASECFKYAVTHEPGARKNAHESLDALLFLETVTDVPGLFARSYVAHDEDTGPGGEWHLTADGKWRWKGDTSSDEAVGRFFGFSVYYDLCADDAEKQLIADSASRTMNRIIDDDYYLLDIDGLPTKWGNWNPKHLATKGRFQRNLNSLEILMMLKATSHFTDEPRFQKEYAKLIKENGYSRNTINTKINMTGMQNHSDDLLAFLSYYPLLKYEKDPAPLEDYHKSIRRTWRIVREKRNPLWNYVYGASVPGDDFDPEGAAWFLRRSPLDLIYWDVRNSQRADLELDPFDGGKPGEKQAKKPLPPDETFMLKFNENPYRLDGYWKGNNSENPSYWLLPYWMGRYHGFIK